MRRFTRWLLTRKRVQAWLRPRLERAIDKYTYWRGGEEDEAGEWVKEPTFYSRELLTIFGWTVELHAFYSPDFEGMFHSHPYNAFRMALSGGYIEEVVPKGCPYIVKENGKHVYTCKTLMVAIHEGDYGKVSWEHTHRIDTLIPHCYAQEFHQEKVRQLAGAWFEGDTGFFPEATFTLWIHGPRKHETQLFYHEEPGGEVAAS